jgi:hypothetical protein
MNYLLITLAILVITNWIVLMSFFKRRVKITGLQNNRIDEELIQKIISSITNGLNPRLVLTTVSKGECHGRRSCKGCIKRYE